MFSSIKPLYVTYVVWGEQFLNYLLNYSLPSLLAKNNINAFLNSANNKILIATTQIDQAKIIDSISFRELSKYVTFQFFDIEICPPGRTGCQHMSLGHKIICDYCFENKVYAIHLTPDCILSDGTLTHISKVSNLGAEVVLAPALRFSEENLLFLIDEYRSNYDKNSINASLSLPSRPLAKIALSSMHSETLAYEIDSPWFDTKASAAWWRFPGRDIKDGILIHTFSWAPLLLDYEIVANHNTNMLDYWTLDGNYIDANFGHSKNVLIIQDSDLAFHCSWAPKNDRPRKLDSNFIYKFNLFGFNAKYLILNKIFNHESIDSIKKVKFLLPTFIHSVDLTPDVYLLEKKLQNIFDLYLNDKNKKSFLLKILTSILIIFLLLSSIWKTRKKYLSIFFLAISGDKKSAEVLLEKLLFFIYEILNKQVKIKNIRKD